MSEDDGSSSALGGQPAAAASAGAQPNYYPHGFDYGAVTTGSARAATPTSADAAARRALSEQHAGCRTFGSADAIERCMTHLR